jgi:two-component system, chemotaxis family, sensor kinase CheA
MTIDDPAFMQRLLATFRVEADEHLQTMSSLLLELERPGSDPTPRLEALFREAHSLKGAARAVNAVEVERLCAAMERVLSSLKRHDSVLSPALFDALHHALDGVARALDGTPLGVAAISAAVAALEAVPPLDAGPKGARAPVVAEPAPTTAAASAAGGDTVRIAVSRLESLLVQAEELLAFKFSAEQLAGETAEFGAVLAQYRRDAERRAQQVRAMRRADSAAQPASDPVARGRRRRALAQLLESVERDEPQVKTLHERATQLERLAAQERRALASRVDGLLEDMKQALMLPFSSLLEAMPKLVRDLAHDRGKDVELELSGTTLEIDRRILEQMKTPLIHLVRNAVDHGIETPEQRLRIGKPQRGRITIEVMPREGNKVELAVADDGAGIALAQVQAQARRMGLASASAATGSARDALALVFESGLSTRPNVTDLSGHGLGLAIVREKIEKLGGTIALDSQERAGTRFSIVLPATLANFRGLLVAVGERQFVLPSRHVERVARIFPKTVTTVQNRETIDIERQVLALVRLGDVLKLPVVPRPDADAPLQVAVLSAGGRRMAFVVDEVLGDQEVLVKPLGPLLKRVPNVAAATVLGAGRLVPLLDVADLMKAALRAGAKCSVAPHPATETPPRSLLVVEDSITSRGLLKGVLESAGYRVSTAVDGVDALNRLRDGEFDLVVSDVEMPRLDGFGLTARLRADKQWAKLPVVLMTTLGSGADHQRGMEAGASAYIVKSGFDQGKLLDVIRGLVPE